jgi:hypothetical protein
MRSTMSGLPRIHRTPFAKSYWSKIPGLASVSCRYLQRIARAGNKDSIRTLASLALELTETLSDLLDDEAHASGDIVDEVKWIAEELPYWPVLFSRNTAANNHLPRVVDSIGLGKRCYLNVSEKANYSLRTPINRFVGNAFDTFKKCIKSFMPQSDRMNRLRRSLIDTSSAIFLRPITIAKWSRA